MSVSAPAATGRPDPAVSELLKPYVPRLVVDWLRTSPDALHREVEGTLVFVDISGFTALTERLARKGKIGAELMRDTLDGVFTALLDEAYDWGAGLLKWGGDALLLLFDGPDHEVRATRAAWEMQGTIARVGRVQASGEPVILRMSVGIGTGRFHFFMTGSVHRELLLAGPAISNSRWTLPVMKKWNIPVPMPTDIRRTIVPPLRCSRPTRSMVPCISQAARAARFS